MSTKQYILTVIALVAINAPKAAFCADSQEDLGSDLRTAVNQGNAERVHQLLLNPHTNVNDTNHYGNTALMNVLENNTIKEKENIAKMLLDARADVNLANDWGETALTIIAHHGENTNIVKMLICADADINHVTRWGHSALHLAARRGNRDIAQILLLAGAKPLSDDELENLSERGLSPATMRQLQAEISQEYRESFGQWCEHIDEEYDVPHVLQRLIVRDMLGTVPEQMPFQ